MKEFGTFDTLTDEEDTLYNRLAFIRRELDRLELEQNEAQQDIKMWRNKMLDDKFKVKFWFVAALIVGVGALPWHMIVLYAVPPGINFHYAKIFAIIATFIALMETFMFLPLFLIALVICLVHLILNILRNSRMNGISKLAENMGIENRPALIDEQKVIVGNTAKEIEDLQQEEEKIKMRLDSIRRTRENMP